MEVAVALAKEKMKVARNKMRVDWIEVQRATFESKRYPASRHVREVLDTALYQHTIAHTAWMGAIDVLNELYWHEVSEKGDTNG